MSRFLEAVRRRLPDYPAYYRAPHGRLLRLDQNVNRWGAHPAVRRARPDLSEAHLYPDRDNLPLVQAVSAAYGVPNESLWVANGSDEVLDLLIRVFVAPGGRVATPHPSYSLYPHLCRLNRVEHVAVPYAPDFTIEPEALLEPRPDMVLVANPDNPSGTLLGPRFFDALLDAFEGPVVVDEAYADYAGVGLLDRVGRDPNLVVVRTLSKAFGLAGLRVGFAAAHPDAAELVRRARIPFSVNVATQQLAAAALADRGPVEETVERTRRERTRLAKALQGLGFDVVPSHTNFILTRPPIDAARLQDALKAQGILTRTFPAEPALAGRLRFTVGLPEEVDRLVESLGRVLASGGGPR